ncbi:hypothetical protein BURCENBC7_AP4621 [Burkholderia cenocepacia BC7]|nr:hypothetical protein BURCENK562V_C0628 [Burkholderia cenocepacia K56-2Valvano]ERI30101.1 hypothetical protein BURCENBC7_AP4621 [Burkholderia cenocepacia BC7]
MGARVDRQPQLTHATRASGAAVSKAAQVHRAPHMNKGRP